MKIFAQFSKAPLGHRVMPYDREAIVRLLWSLKFQSTAHGYERDVLNVFFDETEVLTIETLASRNSALAKMSIADDGSKKEMMADAAFGSVFYVYTNVSEVVTAYLSGVPIWVPYADVIAAGEQWANSLARMRQEKRKENAY
jgi:hypothetical protein